MFYRLSNNLLFGNSKLQKPILQIQDIFVFSPCSTMKQDGDFVTEMCISRTLFIWIIPCEDAGGLSREYVLCIPSVS